MRGRNLRRVAIGGAAVLALSLGLTGAQAVPSSFLELDGNVIFDAAPSATYDWANNGTLTTTGGTYTRDGSGGIFDGGHFNGNTTPPTAPTLTAAAAADASIVDGEFKIDPLSVDVTSCGTGDPTVYTGAGSETNGDTLSTETYGTGSVPNKDDLSNVYAVAHVDANANEVFFGGERVVNNGDSHIDFEFLQASVTKTGTCSGSFVGNRTDGDFLLAVDFTTGGTLGGTTLYKWVCGNVTPDPVTKICNPAKAKGGPHYEAGANDAVTITVNGGGNVGCGGWVCRNPDGSPNLNLQTNELMEGGINLAQIGFTGCVSTFLPHTRSSQSFTSVLKDFEIIPFNTCVHPSIATELSTSSAIVGDFVHDSATLTGASAGAGGTVTYTVFDNNTCTSNANDRDAGTVTVTNGIVPDSNALQFNSVGTFYWQAVYSGDIGSGGRNFGATSPCTSEVLTVAKKQPSIATTLSDTSVPIGSTVHDSSTLTGETSTAGGTVTYTVYDNNTCTSNANDRDAGTKTVTNGVVPDSNGLQFNSAGTFYWQAVYSGDAANEGATSVCLSEILTVPKNQPSIATTLSATSVPIGTTVHDSADLTGATANAGGTVTYTVYDNSTCTSNANDRAAGTKTVTNGVVPDSNGLQFNTAGTFYWQAVYSGDANNEGATSVCTSEILTVVPNTPVPHSTPVLQIKDTFSVGGFTSDATGSVAVGMFSDSGCTLANQIGSNTLFPISGHLVNGTLTDATTFVAATEGSYYFKISYAGDPNNDGFSSCAESASVTITSLP